MTGGEGDGTGLDDGVMDLGCASLVSWWPSRRLSFFFFLCVQSISADPWNGHDGWMDGCLSCEHKSERPVVGTIGLYIDGKSGG